MALLLYEEEFPACMLLGSYVIYRRCIFTVSYALEIRHEMFLSPPKLLVIMEEETIVNHLSQCVIRYRNHYYLRQVLSPCSAQ